MRSRPRKLMDKNVKKVSLVKNIFLWKENIHHFKAVHFLIFFLFCGSLSPTWIRIQANPDPQHWYFELRQCHLWRTIQDEHRTRTKRNGKSWNLYVDWAPTRSSFCNGTGTWYQTSAVNPDRVGSAPICRIWIGIIIQGRLISESIPYRYTFFLWACTSFLVLFSKPVVGTSFSAYSLPLLHLSESYFLSQYGTLFFSFFISARTSFLAIFSEPVLGKSLYFLPLFAVFLALFSKAVTCLLISPATGP